MKYEIEKLEKTDDKWEIPAFGRKKWKRQRKSVWIKVVALKSSFSIISRCHWKSKFARKQIMVWTPDFVYIKQRYGIKSFDVNKDFWLKHDLY